MKRDTTAFIIGIFFFKKKEKIQQIFKGKIHFGNSTA